ncbi:hypothetical protein CAPTEDRAFT_135328, partial [Capitella teleta]
FWFPEGRFGVLPGVRATRVGYTGGTLVDPCYHNMGDHTESVQVEYNPDVISYPDLLDIFWNNHNCTSASSRQYMSAIFCHDDQQRSLAEETKDEHQRRIGRPVSTVIQQVNAFYDAEE